MSKPKNMTPEEEASWKKKQRERNARWRRNNPEKARAASANWRNNNPEKARAASKRWGENNPEKAKDASANWRKNNPEKTKGYSRKTVDPLKISYVAMMLGVKTSTLRSHPDLLEAKREHIKTLRQLKQQNAPESKQPE